MLEEIKIWIGKKVKVEMDRPLGTKHPDPRFETIYPINYGFIPGTLSEADNEEIDAYVLGPMEPLQEFDGIVIAGIKRGEDGEIKLIVTSGEDYSIKEIEELTDFQEKYHEHKIYK